MFIIKHFVLLLVFFISIAYAEEKLFFTKVGYQVTSGSYSQKSSKKSIESKGVVLNVKFLEDLNLAYTDTDTVVTFKNNFKITQKSKFISVGYNIYTNKIGVINLRVDKQTIDNDDATGATDDVTVHSVQTSIMPYDKSYYTEVGFSQSNYPYTNNAEFSTELNINQINLSYGFSPDNNDWITVKGYMINSSDATRSYDKEAFSAFEVKYKYFFGNNIFKLHNIELSALGGEKIFAVDTAAGATYNMGDMQTGTIGFNANWKFGEDANVLFSISQEKYKTNAVIPINYTGNYVYLNFNYNF